MALCFPHVLEDVKHAFAVGIQGLERFVELLQRKTARSAVTSLAAVERVAGELRPHVNRAFEHFSRANEVVCTENARISGEIEGTVAEQHELSCAIEELEAGAENLRSRIAGLNTNIADAETQVRDARNVLSSAESTLRDAREELRKRETERDVVRGVGGGLFVIPFLGWAVGGTMVAVSFTALEDAVKSADDAVDSARDNVRSRENSLDEKKRDVENLQEEMGRKECERENKVQDRDRRQRELELKKEVQKKLLEVGQQLKYLVTATSTTQGRTKVLRNQLKDIYTLETLFQPLQAIATHLQSDEVNKSRLLTGELSLVSSIHKFRMICDSAATPSELDDFC